MEEPTSSHEGLKDNGYSGSCSTMYREKLSRVKPLWEMSTCNDVCQLDDKDDFPVGSSFNPMSEPFDDWPCKFDLSPGQGRIDSEDFDGTANRAASSAGKGESDFTIPSELVSEEDDEVTESKIRAFLDEKALDLKKLQTPLYEEFFNSLGTTNEPCIGSTCEENVTNNSKVPPKSKSSPHKAVNGPNAPYFDTINRMSPGNCSRRISSSGVENNQILREIPSPRPNDWGGLLQDAQQEPNSPSTSLSDRRRKWKEELDQELEREREMMRQAGGGKASSPKDRRLSRKRDRFLFTSPGK